MAEETTIYDLMLLLSTTVEEDRRAKILSEVEGAISSGGGAIVHNGDWGTRPLSYGIDHQNEAEYHLLQFTGPTALLDTLRHSLGIEDGVLRSRIIRVLPGMPPPPTPTPVAVQAPRAAEATQSEAPAAPVEAPAAPVEAPAAEVAEAPAEDSADAPGAPAAVAEAAPEVPADESAE